MVFNGDIDELPEDAEDKIMKNNTDQKPKNCPVCGVKLLLSGSDWGFCDNCCSEITYRLEDAEDVKHNKHCPNCDDECQECPDCVDNPDIPDCMKPVNGHFC
jgi:hypothetical protein